MTTQQNTLIIESVKEDGNRFRPSDWIERISSILGSFGPDHRLHYNQSVRPGMVDGEKCLVVNQALKSENPDAYEYIEKFVSQNGLRTRMV
ncbi:MAG: DUF3579 domain-containing protein [Gammaproteobacteria bacterium]|nr:DUF3579 domain-containing protein [Gammaproteobacteria bacterium]MDH5729253.1 DUF3579 domain-containing protein [Gammaproteobacteria bacterium]